MTLSTIMVKYKKTYYPITLSTISTTLFTASLNAAVIFFTLPKIVAGGKALSLE